MVTQSHGEGRRSATPLHLHKCVEQFVSDSLVSCIYKPNALPVAQPTCSVWPLKEKSITFHGLPMLTYRVPPSLSSTTKGSWLSWEGCQAWRQSSDASMYIRGLNVGIFSWATRALQVTSHSRQLTKNHCIPQAFVTRGGESDTVHTIDNTMSVWGEVWVTLKGWTKDPIFPVDLHTYAPNVWQTAVPVLRCQFKVKWSKAEVTAWRQLRYSFVPYVGQVAEQRKLIGPSNFWSLVIINVPGPPTFEHFLST